MIVAIYRTTKTAMTAPSAVIVSLPWLAKDDLLLVSVGGTVQIVGLIVVSV